MADSIFKSSLSTLCSELLHPSFVNLTISITITLGILLSYLPQHHRILSRRTSEGISPFFVLLGVTSGTCAFANILLLSRDVLGCCKEIGGLNCTAASLGVIQVGLQWTCFAIICALYIIFFPKPVPAEHPHTISSTHPTFKTAVIVVVLCIVHGIATLAASLYAIYWSGPATVEWLAAFLGIQATILASVQYLPQIWTTWQLKQVGSLSIPMMCIQTPGSFVWAASLAMREGTNWSSWMVYIVTGCLQGSLLVMCIAWEMRARKIGPSTLEEEEEEEAPVANERSALLH